MAAISNVQVTISLAELGLDDEELQTEVENLLPQLREVDGVEDADLVAVENAPKGTKAFGGFLLGLLNAQVNAANIKTLFNFLGDRFGNKPIKIGVKAPDGRELNIEASSREEFEFALQKAQDFLNNKSNS
ncbi:sugar ABC transporter permease [Nostoc flagelliforme FACHB-838]|uniref:Sugar ABC transporter permease n=1 Tax=Nostoc flagelliforme FACHB-838 TaxID=2692904 RepID=A0ABR8DHX0_9NOSO|nr:sugar ABC transporter permease [Nostoc flagelliforme]MBD2529036.1 sugar ABC transporter permease [Nostoc flagelliforme FACHB-838]